jgi:7-cyano-7-deazaguanine reductase
MTELDLKSLGKRRDTPVTYTPSLLEAVPFAPHRPFSGQESFVTLNCLRFTSLCPVTGQPDWADLTINYIPERLLVESKALKEYLNSFRMHGDFHEDVCRIIVDDLAALLSPRYLELSGRFDARGSIAIWPFVQYSRPNDSAMRSILEARRAAYRPGGFCVPGSVQY